MICLNSSDAANQSSLGRIAKLGEGLSDFGLKLGLLGILAGNFTPAESLELPGYATPILLIAYALIGAWGVQTFLKREKRTVNVSQWYILGALFWFPWIYMIAQFNRYNKNK